MRLVTYLAVLLAVGCSKATSSYVDVYISDKIYTPASSGYNYGRGGGYIHMDESYCVIAVIDGRARSLKVSVQEYVAVHKGYTFKARMHRSWVGTIIRFDGVKYD